MQEEGFLPLSLRLEGWVIPAFVPQASGTQ